MKFGRVNDLTKVDFSMPNPPNATNLLLDNLSAPTNGPKIYFGCTGWGMKEWIGTFYPPKAKSKEFLKHYNKQFTTIELNTTHYRIPTPDLVKTWYQMTDDNFKFSPKIPQSISHAPDLGRRGKEMDWFCESIVGLGEKLGTSFMQLPPNFGPGRLRQLDQFLSDFPIDEVPLAIEVRQEDWFGDEKAFQQLLYTLREHQVGTVITDVAGRRDVLHLGLTTPQLLLRFVGNGLHPSDYQRVDAWITLILDWLERGLEEVYFFSHQPDNILSPEMCIYFLEQLEARSALRFSKKTKILNDGQMSLF
ncbi:MAG: DUF72 domain-containing protein [Aureispira sp.]